MKPPGFSVLVSLLALASQAYPATPVLRLSGIINLPNRKQIVLESRESPSLSFILREKERCSVPTLSRTEPGSVEVIEIDPQHGTAKLKIDGADTPLSLSLSDTNSLSQPVNGIAFNQTSPSLVLTLYQSFLGRTILRPSSLAAFKVSLNETVTTQQEAARVLENALARNGVATILDGDKFVRVVPNSMAASMKPRPGVDQTKILPGQGSGDQESIPPGFIDFRNAAIEQILPIYAALAGRKLDTSLPLLSGPTISMKSETALTKAEASYALETLFLWAGVEIVPGEPGLVKAVPAR
jgi:hypothetical protein